MPFPIQVLEPKCLSRDPLTTKLGEDHLEAVFNSTASNVIRQLACLTTVAERIFLDLTSQMKDIQRRAEKLSEKVVNVESVVSRLDAKQTLIPAGSLDEFSRLQTHYSSSKCVDKCLFTSKSRPNCVNRIYESVIPSPIQLVRTIDPYRKDGQRSSNLFLCMPFFKDVRVPYDVDIEMRRPASLSSAKLYHGGYRSDEDSSVLNSTREEDEEEEAVDKSVDKSVDSSDGGVLDLDVTLLPTPDEKIYVESLKFPQSDVTVDVSGNGFRRMSSLRRSFIHQMETFNSKRKKRKRKTAAEEKTTNGETAKNKLNDGASTSKEGLKTQKKENKEVQTCFEETKEKTNGLYRWFQRKPRSRNSIIGGIAIYEELDRVKKSKRRSIAGSLWIHSSNSSSSCSPSKSSTDSAVATGTSSVSDTNLATLKSTGVKLRGKGHRVKREDGGQSSSGNWSASSSTRTSMESEDPIVTTANIGDNRLLLMTATATLPRCYGVTEKKRNSASQCSSRKESLTSERSSKRDRGTESSSGYLSDGPHFRSSFARRSLPPRMANSATVTARWLRSLEEEGGGPLCSETTDATSSTGTITPRVHRRQRPLSPLVFVDDGESSEFSVDTDGYYTSMHTDSGLRQLPQLSAHMSSRLSDLREQGSNSTLSSVSSGRTTSSSSSKKATTTSSSENTSSKDSSEAPATIVTTPETGAQSSKKTPPPPPPRTSTVSSTTTSSSSNNNNNNNYNETSFDSYLGDDDQSRKISTASDSDADANERLQSKTKMNSDRIPSLCVVTPSASDDEDNQASGKTVVDQKVNASTNNIHDLRSSFHSLPRSTPIKKDTLQRDQRAYRTLPRNYIRGVSSIENPDTKTIADDQHQIITTAPPSNYTLNGATRTMAHVTLDPTGKVTHVTHSLPRRFSLSNLPGGRPPPNLTNVHRSNSTVSQPPVPVLNSFAPVSQCSNPPGGYPHNTFPRWRPNQPANGSLINHSSNNNNTPSEAATTTRRWNNFGFLKRDASQPPYRSPIGAYIRMDGHPEHLEPGILSRTINSRELSTNNDKNLTADRVSLQESTSNEELCGNQNVPLPPAAMPLLQNTNYGHASRIPTRPMSIMNNSNVLPPYYSPVQNRCPPGTATITTSTPSNLLVSSDPRTLTTTPPIVLSRGPIVTDDKSLLSPTILPPPGCHSTPLNSTQCRPSPSTLSSANLSYSRLNSAQSVLSHALPARNPPATKCTSAQRALFPSQSAYPNQAVARPLSVSTYNQRSLPSNSTTLSPKRTPPVVTPRPSSSLSNGSAATATPVASTMTTDQLFAAIHQSKKKMNIKSDVETSFSPTSTATSSRSNSPSLKNQPVNGNRPETGVLSPRTTSPPNVIINNVSERKAGDRRSWTLGDCTPSSPANTPIEARPAGDRRSWASDRLGPSKPTSLHDFKLLLLQAGRGNNQIGNGDGSPGRKSAAEMLKTSSSSPRSVTPTMLSSKSRLGSPSLQSSSTIPGRSSSPKTLVNGHLSRSLNGRMRNNCSVLHNRTDILSTPIPEDEGSEDEDDQYSLAPLSNGGYTVHNSVTLPR